MGIVDIARADILASSKPFQDRLGIKHGVVDYQAACPTSVAAAYCSFSL